VEMIADGDKKRAGELQQLYVHNLGNLTLSGYNSVLGNKSFIEKRDRKDRQGRPVGYNNGLKLNEDLVVESNWDIEKIEQRTQKLVQQALDLFNLGSK
ncbi:MAG: HNH endonuclease family protein, partial [Balneolales bacterium]|nr:HNH endonuclease family protein [Balneolales bacterium]